MDVSYSVHTGEVLQLGYLFLAYQASRGYIVSCISFGLHMLLIFCFLAKMTAFNLDKFAANPKVGQFDNCTTKDLCEITEYCGIPVLDFLVKRT